MNLVFFFLLLAPLETVPAETVAAVVVASVPVPVATCRILDSDFELTSDCI